MVLPEIDLTQKLNFEFEFESKKRIDLIAKTRSNTILIDFKNCKKINMSVYRGTVKHETTTMTINKTDSDFIGALIQIEDYKQKLISELQNLKEEFPNVNNPKTIIIGYNADHLKPKEQRSFELFRNSIDTKIITLDEIVATLHRTIEIASSKPQKS